MRVDSGLGAGDPGLAMVIRPSRSGDRAAIEPFVAGAREKALVWISEGRYFTKRRRESSVAFLPLA